MTNRKTSRLALALLLAGMPLLARGAGDTVALHPFTYVYDVAWGSLGIGRLQLQLAAQPGHPDCYRYTTTTQPNAMVRLFYGAPSQRSDFCIVDGRVQSQKFVSTLPGDDAQSYRLFFDWKRHEVSDEHGKTRSIPDDAVDTLALQQAVRLWLHAHPDALSDGGGAPTAAFTMVDNKHLTHYRFRFSGHVGVDTPAGHFDTVLMERIDSPGRVGRFWLAPTHDDMPVKSETRIGSKPAVTMVLAR